MLMADMGMHFSHSRLEHVAQNLTDFSIQGQGAADGTGQLIGNGALDSEDGEFTGTGTFTGVGDCEGATDATY